MAEKSLARHILLVPIPIHGHITPMLQLGLQLASLGSHAITFVTTSSTHDATLSLLKVLVGDELKGSQGLGFQVLDDSSSTKKYEFRESIEFIARSSDAIANLVENAVREKGPLSLGVLDFLVFDPLTRDKDLAPLLRGVPIAALWTVSAAMLQLAVNIGTLLDKSILPLSQNAGITTVDSSIIPGLRTELSIYTDIPEDTLDPTFQAMRGLKALLLAASPLMINTLDEIETETLDALRKQGFTNLLNFGPLLFQPGTKVDDQVLEWLDERQPSSVLYVAFGTMVELPGEQIVEIGRGLEESKHKFVWVLRESTQRKAPPKFLEALRERTGERGLIVPWSWQHRVLQHPSVGGFLTHAGWNSVLESLSSGVPMIAWSFTGDQILHSKFIADVWRVGVRVESKSSVDGSQRMVTSSELQHAITALMSSDAIRGRARKLRVKAGEAVKLSRLRLAKLLECDDSGEDIAGVSSKRRDD